MAGDGSRRNQIPDEIMNYPPIFESIWDQAKTHTMTSKNRAFALFEAINYILDNGIPGMFVECGVWRGGSAMIIAATLVLRKVNNRRIFLYDTFEGMTEPGESDYDLNGNQAIDLLNAGGEDSLVKARCDIASVRANMLSTGFPRERVSYIQGDVRSTLKERIPEPIALLRLDTDFEDSTAAELDYLYPTVSSGGVVIIDDYGHWHGARKAVDVFLDRERESGRKHFMVPLDYTGRLFVKPPGGQQHVRPAIPSVSLHIPTPAERYDYVAPGLHDPGLLHTFTDLSTTDPSRVGWPFLRREVPHLWRTDSRSTKPNIGVLSLDEAVLLHAAAVPFQGQRGLEIGCHLGFSTAHLVKAGLSLDVIDPMLGQHDHFRNVVETLQRSTPKGTWHLHAGYSPMLVETVFRAGNNQPWSFAFIDGLHESGAPTADAKAVAPFMANTAAVMFHDLACPDVANGLRALAEAGWHTKVYETMQIMGIAWRGDYTPPNHIADPACTTAKLQHLAGLSIH
jgi:predicted O-methyltransferase YrrM